VSIQAGSYSLYIRVERSTNKVKPEPVIINNSSSSSTNTTTKPNRVAHGPAVPASLPSSKTHVTSTTQIKSEPPETSTTGRPIKSSSNGNDRHESPQISMVSTTRESPPTNKKETSIIGDR
jgi:hypothetical protein